MGLRHVVITSVDRDDLENGGAEAFAGSVVEIRRRSPETTVEVLIPDFKGSERALRIVLDARPADFWSTRRSIGADEGAPVWSDVSGAPLLTAAREGRGLHYRFRSRFTPSWSGIVLQPGFPEAIAGLWTGSDSASDSGDDRPIALDQVAPARDPEPRPGAAATGARPLFLLAWLIAVGLFLAERRFAAAPRRGRA